jgi:hypothetical protein
VQLLADVDVVLQAQFYLWLTLKDLLVLVFEDDGTKVAEFGQNGCDFASIVDF